MKMSITGWDCDGVICIPGTGAYPSKNDVIITGRSYEEQYETIVYLEDKGIHNKVFFNPIKFVDKTRESSGYHKGNTINSLSSMGINIQYFWEDDDIQANIIRSLCPSVSVIMVKHDLINKDNIRRNYKGEEIG